MSSSSDRRDRWRVRGAVRRAAGAACGLALVLPAATAGAQVAAVDDRAETLAKIRPAVSAELRAEGDATVLVRFADQADLGAVPATGSWEERGQAVYDALSTTADRSQAEARSLLDDAGVDYQSFFVSNAILVESGDAELVTALAGEPEVEGVYEPARVEAPHPAPGASDVAPAAVEWNIADINADDVWSQLGVTGSGITVGSIDTGVDYTHPALVRQYRGTNGDSTFSHDYNWFDAAGTGAAAPADHSPRGHGTHTTGTMVGDDAGAGRHIGVAPGARWVAANACCGTTAELVAAGQWMLAPTDRAGRDPRPDLRPHIVNNSWGTSAPGENPFFEDVSRAWAAAGMFAVFSNGNAGPKCQTSGAPGSRIVNYSVGSYGVDHQIDSSSSRGAGQDGELKPNISAPGVDVVSAYPGGGYVRMEGTSMAAPHVAGSVALLWSAVPELVGDVATTRLLLDGSAIDSPATQCGGTASDNNVFGEGRLDALALLRAAGAGDPVVARISGVDRYDTAAKVARQFEPGVHTVVIASGREFPDALAGAARAGSLGGPVLLVRPSSVPEQTRLELVRLRPRNVVIAGGTGAVSATVETAIRSLVPATSTVTRKPGANRYDTAARIAADVTSAERVFVASGQDFPDALAGAARAGSVDAPLLLVRSTSVPAETRAQLQRLQPREIVLLGGTGAVSSTVQNALRGLVKDVTVTRVSGTDRYETAARVAQLSSGAADAYVATGVDWPDALAGAARAAATDAPVLLVRKGEVPPVTDAELTRLDPRRTLVLGGPVAVAEAVLATLRTPL